MPAEARAPWECPRCHSINAPHVDRCGCVCIASGGIITKPVKAIIGEGGQGGCA